MIQVTHVLHHANTELSRQVWNFWLRTAGNGDNPVLVLDEYRAETRASKRSNFKIVLHYKRIPHRPCCNGTHLQVNEVELPTFVIEQAREQLMAELKVEK